MLTRTFGKRSPAARPHPARPDTQALQIAAMTLDYKQNGTTTLFAPLDTIEGKVIGRCVSRHLHQESIGFLAKLAPKNNRLLDEVGDRARCAPRGRGALGSLASLHSQSTCASPTPGAGRMEVE